jgi:hypothetical protein
MKTLQQLKKQDPIFLDIFTNEADVYREFRFEGEKAIKILFASYMYESYSGNAFVLFEQDGKLYEVHGGHCSCYGLEGQWEPEETALESLKLRFEKGHLGRSEYSTELQEFLGL